MRGACCGPALVCDGSDSQPHEAPRRPCILDIDMFHHLVALCFSLPALYADDDSPAAYKQLLVATGGLNDLHALHLVFTAHVVQLLLAACVNLRSEGNLFIVSFYRGLTPTVTSDRCIAVRKVAAPLRELTCHMGSHSVTCHPAEVTFPPLPQPKLVQCFSQGFCCSTQTKDIIYTTLMAIFMDYLVSLIFVFRLC